MEFHENYDARLLGEAQPASDYETERGKPMPSKNHARVQANLTALMVVFYKKRFSIYTELSLELDSKLATPDLAIYEADSADWFEDEIRVTRPPLTTVEILSPRQNLQDLTDKVFEIYFPAGVKSAWIVIPTMQTVHILTPPRTLTTFTSGKLTDPAVGIELKIAEIFE